LEKCDPVALAVVEGWAAGWDYHRANGVGGSQSVQPEARVIFRVYRWLVRISFKSLTNWQIEGGGHDRPALAVV